MKLILEIDLETRQFQKPGIEVSKILRDYCRAIENAGLSTLNRRLYLDGKTVGQAKVERN